MPLSHLSMLRRKSFLHWLFKGLTLTAWLLGAHEDAVAAQPVTRVQATPLASQVSPLQILAAPEKAPPEPKVPIPVRRSGTPGPRVEVSRSMVLPDLRTLPPVDLDIQAGRDGERELRLTNIIWNSGAGPLEVIGEFNRATRRTQVRQRVYDQGQDSQKTFREIPVGEFVWHPTHDHWHIEGFALYRLWGLTDSGGLDQVISSSDKLSYCLMDSDVIDRQNPGYLPRRRYYECENTLQGISAGWGDRYKSYLDGQSLDLSAAPDGFYALESAVNPEGVLLETDTGNNSAVVILQIQGRDVTVISKDELSEMRCEENGWC